MSRRKGQQLEPSEQYMFNKLEGGRSMLTIRNIRQGDGGAYTCRATNKAGSQERELFLKVFGKADVAPSHEPGGKSLVMTCILGVLGLK